VRSRRPPENTKNAKVIGQFDRCPPAVATSKWVASANVPFGLLAFASGSLDVVSFLRLGNVFASVMTRNMVLVAVSVVRKDGDLGVRCGVALAGYIVGVAVAALAAAPSSDRSGLGGGPLTGLLAGEAVVLAGFSAGWIATGGHPGGEAQIALLAIVAVGMGAQSVAAKALGDPKAGTTFLTGTLTGLVSGLVRSRGTAGADRAAITALVALVIGAAASVALLEVVPSAAPVLALCAVVVTASLSCLLGARRRGDPSARSS
jgi:uncharacterized membrane protein YoaK (UPF0700 family)